MSKEQTIHQIEIQISDMNALSENNAGQSLPEILTQLRGKAAVNKNSRRREQKLPVEFQNIIEAAEQAEKIEKRISDMQQKGQTIPMSLYDEQETLCKKLQDASKVYLDTYEFGTGPEAERFWQAVNTRMYTEKALSNLEANPEYAAYKENKQAVFEMLNDAHKARDLFTSLDDQLMKILREPYTFTGSDGKEHTIAGTKDDPQKGTKCITHAFEWGTEYYGKPFLEVSRTPHCHFRAYCVSRGLSGDELLSMAQNGADEKQKETLRKLKKDFLDMVIKKDTDRISDMYVNLALQVDADRERIRKITSVEPNAIKEQMPLLLKYAGAQSWYSQTINFGGKNCTAEGIQTVGMTNRKLKALNKNFTYQQLAAPIQGINNLTEQANEDPDISEFKDNSYGYAQYFGLYPYLGVIQDALAVDNPDDWLSVMPDIGNELTKELTPKMLNKEGEFRSLEDLLKPYVPTKTPRALELEAAREQEAELKKAEASAEALHQQTSEIIPDILAEIDEEEEREIDLAHEELQKSDPYQSVYEDLFEKAGVRYDPREILKRSQDPELSQLHEQAAKFLQERDQRKKTITGQYPVKDKRFSRIRPYVLDKSDTPEAREKNRKLIDEINTPAGAEAFANRIVRQLLDQDLSELVPTTIEDMARKYMENPDKYDLLWVGLDIITQDKTLPQLQEPLLSEFKEKITFLQTGSYFREAAELMAHSQWAAITQPSLSYDDCNALQMTAAAATSEASHDNMPYAGELSRIPALVNASNLMRMSKAPMERMADQGMLKDHMELKLDRKTITVSALLTEAEKDPSVLKRAYASKMDYEKIRQQEKAHREIPYTVEEVNKLTPYREMLAFHKPYYEGANVPLPTEQELKAIAEDPKGRDLHERAKAFYKKDEDAINSMEARFAATTNPALNRIYRYLMRKSGSLEDAEYNRKIQTIASTPEGQKRIANYVIKELMSQPESFFLPQNLEEAAQRYLENPLICNLGYVCLDLASEIAKPDSPMHVDEPLLSEFKARVPFFQNGGTMKCAAKIMAREDWPLLRIDNMTLDQTSAMFALHAMDHKQPDPYIIIPFDNYGKSNPEICEILGNTEMLHMMTLGSSLHKAYFDHETEVTKDGKKLTVNQIVDTAYKKGTSGFVFHHSEKEAEKWEKINQTLDLMNADFISVDGLEANMLRDEISKAGTIQTRSTTGRGLREDMEALYQSLLDVNHVFHSSKEFTDVLDGVRNLAENIYSSDQAEEALKQVYDFADIYIHKKNQQQTLKTSEQNRLNAVTNIHDECSKRLNIIKTRHQTAQAMHEAVSAQPHYDTDTIKSSQQLYDEETARMPEGDLTRRAREISAKFRIDPYERLQREEMGEKLAEVPSAETIRARLQNPEVQDLHAMAVHNKQIHDYLSSASSKGNKFLCGIADPNARRMGLLLMDPSGTSEAEEHNRLIGAAVSTPEGCQQLYSYIAHEMLTNPDMSYFLTASTMEDMVRAYQNNPKLGEMVFFTEEISDFSSKLEDPLRSALDARRSAIQVGRISGTVIDYLASDAFLAFGDTDLSPEKQERWKAIGNTISSCHPDAELANVATGTGALFVDPATASGFKSMAADLLNPEIYFEDKKGKHLKLDEAARKLNAGESFDIKAYDGEELKKLNSQISKLDVPEPLDIGRRVLEGRQQGITGMVSETNFRDQIFEMRNSLNDIARRHSGEKNPLMDQYQTLLQQMSTAKAGSPEEIKNHFETLQSELKKGNPGAETEFTRELGSWIAQNEVIAGNHAHLADMVSGHNTYINTAPNNGVKAFSDTYLKPDNGFPQGLKNMAEKGLRTMSDVQGMQYSKFPEKTLQEISKGVAAAFLLSQLQTEKNKELAGNVNTLSKLLQEKPKICEALCEGMAKSSDIRTVASIMTRDIESSRHYLGEPKAMANVLRGYSISHKVGKEVEEAEKTTEKRIEAQQKREEQQRKKKEADGIMYSTPAKKAYQTQQKLLGEMLDNPQKFVEGVKAMPGETEAQAQNRSYMNQISKCVSYIIAAKQTEDFIKSKHDELGIENIAKACSEKNLEGRAEMIRKTAAMDLLMGENSPLMKNNNIFKLKQSDKMVTDLTKAFGKMAKITPLSVKDFPAQQAKAQAKGPVK